MQTLLAVSINSPAPEPGNDYKPPFPLTAKLNKLTIKVDRPQLSKADIERLRAAMMEKAKAD
jgi:arylsulfatase